MSDKVSKSKDPTKHCLTPWDEMPPGSRKNIEEYTKLRPDVEHFFCTEDGRQLKRDIFGDLLEPCLLMTDWWQLKITSHLFRLGKASWDALNGVPKAKIREQGRWLEKGKDFDAYAKPDHMALDAEIIYRDYEQYRRTWTLERIFYITRHLIKTPNPEGEPHLFMTHLRILFPKTMQSHIRAWLDKIPHTYCLKKMQHRQECRADGTYLQ